MTTHFEQRLAETGLKSSQVAKLLGIERKSLQLILEGTSKQPSLANLMKVAEFLGLELHSVVASLLQGQSPQSVGALNSARKATFLANYFDLPPAQGLRLHRAR